MSSSHHTDERETDGPALMQRREAIQRVSLMLGGVALVGGSALWTACAKDQAPSATAKGAGSGTFTTADIALLDEIADTILPDTARSPGAKAAQVGAFMAVMVTDCYEPRDQQIFRTGMTQLDAACQKAVNASFLKATPAQRLTVLESLDREAKTYMDTKQPDAPTHYFRMFKELTLVGYFTSEIGATKALQYTETPGRFDPCVPYTKGERAWANHA
jgi:hypothetical protein